MLQIFKTGRNVERCLPPNKLSFHKHIHCASYQAGIHKRCLDDKPNYPSPTNHGWKEDDDELDIDSTRLPTAPASVMELAQYSCKKMQFHKYDVLVWRTSFLAQNFALV